MRVIVEILVLVLLVLVFLGYFTMLERKMLGYAQCRKGPNKGVIFGLVQPLLDGFKLFMKGFRGGFTGTYVSFFAFPFMGLVLVLVLWVLLGGYAGCFVLNHRLLVVLFLGSIVAVLFFVRGFLRGGKYRVLGSMRSLAQALSYEGALVFACLRLLSYSWSVGLNLPVSSCIVRLAVPVLLVGVVIESNRTPVDFVEGESELVSGLATEMAGLSFRFLFLMEYGVIGFYSLFVILLLLGFGGRGYWGLLLVLFIFCVMNWLRMSLPRRRYDLNMLWG